MSTTRSGSNIRARLATTANRSLSGLANIDCKTPVADDIILVANQDDGTQNGLYLAAAGAWPRLKSPAGADVLRPGMFVSVSEGDALGNKVFILTTDSFTVGSDAIAFGRLDADHAAAEAAKDAAVVARGAAENAQAAAEIAQGLSETAQGASEAARDLAVTAKNDAIAAKDLSITAKNDAIAAKVGAIAIVEAAAAFQGGFRSVGLSAASEVTGAIVVTGQLVDGVGNAVAAVTAVLVETVAVTDNKGDISLVGSEGTAKKIANPATGPNVAWLETKSDGTFQISIADDVAEDVLVTARTTNGITTMLKLTFAGGA